MRSKELLDKIIKYSSRFLEEVAAFNALDNYDINIHSENFFIPILNKAFDLDLVNLNNVKKNFPALDLADYQNRVGFQITVSNTNEKVTNTIEKFYKNELYDTFDKVYILILSSKKEKYNIKKLNEILDERLVFDVDQHILDNSDLLKRISDHPLQKLEFYARIYEQQFSDIQIESRQKRFKEGYLSSLPEYIHSNLMPITIPQKIYSAEIQLDEDSILDRWNQNLPKHRKTPFSKVVNKHKAFTSELYYYEIYRRDWLIKNNRVFTFSDLNDTSNELNKFIDYGTIEEHQSSEFYEDPDETRTLKYLLKNSLIEDCSKRGLEFVRKGNLIRFRLPNGFEGDLKVSWKAKKKATKTVIKEMRNKEKGHVICYKHLAFVPKFEFLNDSWYLIVNSTWSFTNPGGKQISRFQDKYLSGIKRMERNVQVYYFTLFWNYYLKYQDLFTTSQKLVNIKPIIAFHLSPSLVDQKWLPVREDIDEIEEEVTLKIDKELTRNLF